MSIKLSSANVSHQVQDPSASCCPPLDLQLPSPAPALPRGETCRCCSQNWATSTRLRWGWGMKGFAIPVPAPSQTRTSLDPPPGTPMWLHSSAVPFSEVVATSVSRGRALQRGRWDLSRLRKIHCFLGFIPLFVCLFPPPGSLSCCQFCCASKAPLGWQRLGLTRTMQRAAVLAAALRADSRGAAGGTGWGLAGGWAWVSSCMEAEDALGGLRVAGFEVCSWGSHGAQMLSPCCTHRAGDLCTMQLAQKALGTGEKKEK